MFVSREPRSQEMSDEGEWDSMMTTEYVFGLVGRDHYCDNGECTKTQGTSRNLSFLSRPEDLLRIPLLAL